MADYVYCPFCKSTNIAKASLNDGSAIDVVCYRCKKTIRETLSRRTCKVCGNVLYYPAGMPEVQLPCAPRHERELAEQQPQPDAVSDDAPETPAQEPDVIQWDNLDGEIMVHVDQRSGSIAPRSLLVVAQGQHVVYDGDGTRRILPPSMYPMFRSEFSQAEMLTLIQMTADPNKLIDTMRNQGLTLGFGTRLIFFDERRFEFDEVCRFELPEQGWSLTVPFRISMQMNRENAERLMDVGLDFSDDRKATDHLKKLVFREYSQILSQHLTARANDGALKALHNPVAVIVWVKDVFSVEALQRVTEAANAALEAQYGISLPAPIRISANDISVEVTSPPPCDHVNRVRNSDFDARKPFTCHGEKCQSITANIYVNKSWLRVCPVCGTKEELTGEQKIPDHADIIAGNAYVKALAMEYDAAEELFRKAYLLSGDEDLQPGYLWWAVKCCFGIEYVKEITYENDPEQRSCQYTPTSARFPFNQEALTGSETLELFDEYLAGHPHTVLSDLYSKMLQLYQEIDEVRRDTRNHCDVFIAWHDREDSKRCQEYAAMLRNRLNGAGKHCFVSFSNLSGKSVWHYEAYIYAALASAKAFVIVIDDYDAIGRKFLGSEVRRIIYRKRKKSSLKIVFVGMEGHTGAVPPMLNGVQRHFEDCACDEEDVQRVGEQVVRHLAENDTETSGMRTSGKFDYYLLDDGSAEITAYQGKDLRITVPATLDGRRVTSIGDSAFNHCGMRTIRLPNGLERIGNVAFMDCQNLTSVVVQHGLSSIGFHAFSGCGSLVAVDLPDSVREIQDDAFKGCSKLTRFRIPVGLESLGIRAFCGCRSLTVVEIPDSVVSIGIDAFRDCDQLTRITAPRHLAHFFPEALQGIITYRGVVQQEPPAAEPAQAEPEPPADMPTTDPDDFDFKEQDNHEVALIGYHGESAEVVIPDRVDENRVSYIGFHAFADCEGLKAVHIPNSVTSIGRYAFAWCGELTRIHISGSVTNIGMGTFMDCASLQEISIPD
ncbi:MAG: leucine-rich repeat domain-containing protein, partial [bacterium]